MVGPLTSILNVRRVADFTFSVFFFFLFLSENDNFQAHYKLKWKLTNYFSLVFKLSQILVFALLDNVFVYFLYHQTEEKKDNLIPPLS